MKECSKSIQRRLQDSNFIRKYFVGSGIDIGGKPDPLCLYDEFFPLLNEVRTWDWEDGDAQYLKGVADESVDFVHSSHCLEHLVDPKEGLRNWIRIVREGGYLIISVPDEDLYEQGIFPSTFNKDHKWTFSIYKSQSWSDRSINLLNLLQDLGSNIEIIKIEVLNATYRPSFPRFDQSITPVAECSIEFILRKLSKDEVKSGCRNLLKSINLSREKRIHLNQYICDMQVMKSNNSEHPPFLNESDI